AGVTVLALGNGSPDLFSTFSALDTGAGSLAIGELIGAAFFIVAIVSGCMGIIQPFQSQRVTFMRDASFLTGAIIIMTWIVYHQRIAWYHSVMLICYYLSYVCVVVLGAYGESTIPSADPLQTELKKDDIQFTVADESTCLLQQGGRNKPPRLIIPERGFSTSIQSNMSNFAEHHLGHVIKPTSPMSSHVSMYYDAIASRSTSATGSALTARTYRRPMTPRVGIRTSVFGAIEFQEQINAIRRADSSNHTLCQSQYRQRQSSYSVWQNTHDTQHDKRLPLGRPRASTMTDPSSELNKAHTLSNQSLYVPSSPATEDYFTFLSAAENQPHLIHVQSSSPPTQSTTIPEIRLAPPNNEHNRLAIPTSSLHSSDFTRARSRANSNYSLAPPSIMSECDSFVSARQSFELSPSNSFDHSLKLQALLENNSNKSKRSSLHQDQLNIPIIQSDTLYMHHHEDQDDYSFISSLNPQQPEHYPTYQWSRFPSLSNTLHQLYDTLFPTLEGWHQKSLFSKLSSLMAAPLVLMFTLTLPVAELDETDVVNHSPLDEYEEDMSIRQPVSNNYLSVPTSVHEYMSHSPSSKVPIENMDKKQGWNKHLLMIQCVVSTVFVFRNLAANEILPNSMILLGVVMGAVLAVFINKSTKKDEAPTWYWLLSFVGFFVALNWIFLLANQVVGLLQASLFFYIAIGKIFSISDAIMGLTVFALGNSIGDFVANTAIAKMGFPTMAISACYAGPLLNMVLGVGVSSLYQNIKLGTAYQLEIAPTILVSAFGLITVLMSTLVLVNINGYKITSKL
ncbi:hypothetical protein CU098_004468, partial [Rhizopus stolonifer]